LELAAYDADDALAGLMLAVLIAPGAMAAGSVEAGAAKAATCIACQALPATASMSNGPVLRAERGLYHGPAQAFPR